MFLKRTTHFNRSIQTVGRYSLNMIIAHVLREANALGILKSKMLSG